MEQTKSLGALVREHRLAKGYSLGQLATKVHKTAASIRAWEKGELMPDAAEAAALATALDLDATTLQALVPVADDPAAGGDASPLADPWTAEAATARRSSDEVAEAPPAAAVESGEIIEEGPGAADPPSPDQVAAAVAAAERAAFHEAQTEAVPVVPGAPLAVADGGGDAAPAYSEVTDRIVEAWDQIRRWYDQVFDPERKWIYRVRWVLLFIALYIMLRVLGWAVSNLWDAIQEVLDSISFSPTETPDVAS